MRDYNIAVIPGDGIGNESSHKLACGCRRRITDRYKFRYEHFRGAAEYYLRHGEMMASNGLEILKPFDAIFFGAVGFPSVPDHITLRGLRLPICQGFEQYVCYRPSLLLPGVKGRWLASRRATLTLSSSAKTRRRIFRRGRAAHRGLPIEVACRPRVYAGGRRAHHRYAFELRGAAAKHLVSATSRTRSNTRSRCGTRSLNPSTPSSGCDDGSAC